MVKKQESKSKAGSQSKSHGFKFPCCSSENMAQMIQKFCGGKDGGFDCAAMMEKMCDTGKAEPDQE